MKYLHQDFSEEGLTKFYSQKLEPHKHTTWEGDFMGMCQHDIACNVCFDAPAMICKDVSCPRTQKEDHKVWSVQPCRACQEKGFMTARMPKLLRRFFV